MTIQQGNVAGLLGNMSVVPWPRFHLINIAEWESVEDVGSVIESEGSRNLTGPNIGAFPHFPGLYEAVRT